ncbi:MAG: hypothetical protein IK015_06135 [Treponema sp.]|nr:hypothetical protein [Treponema sp.]
MTQITIKTESSFPAKGELSEYGFTFSYSEAEDEAVLFDLSQDFCSKLVPKEPVGSFFKELRKIDLQKLLWEEEKIRRADGFYLIVEISSDSRNLSLELNNPSMQIYKDDGCEESFKFLELVQKMTKFAKEQGVDFELEEELGNGLSH